MQKLLTLVLYIFIVFLFYQFDMELINKFTQCHL